VISAVGVSSKHSIPEVIFSITVLHVSAALTSEFGSPSLSTSFLISLTTGLSNPFYKAYIDSLGITLALHPSSNF